MMPIPVLDKVKTIRLFKCEGKNNLLTLSLYYFSAKMIWTPANKNSPAFTALSPPITVKARQANGRRKMLKVHHNETGK